MRIRGETCRIRSLMLLERKFKSFLECNLRGHGLLRKHRKYGSDLAVLSLCHDEKSMTSKWWPECVVRANGAVPGLLDWCIHALTIKTIRWSKISPYWRFLLGRKLFAINFSFCQTARIENFFRVKNIYELEI